LLFPIAAIADQELIEIFIALDSYPAIDDEAISEIEHDLEIECFDSFGAHDFRDHLRVKLDDSFESQIEDLSHDQLTAIYFECSRHTNYNVFEVESGTSGYFNFDSFGGINEKQIELFKKELIKLRGDK
jgi:hypothetical protein